MKMLLMGLLLFSLCASSGCAMIAGTATGAATGMIDAPAETYRHNTEAFENNPILFGLNALVMGPIGIVTGPVFGFGKGLSLDIQCAIGQVDYEDVFRTYSRRSIWRPHSLGWTPKYGTTSSERRERHVLP